jgi:hypothetical protein
MVHFWPFRIRKRLLEASGKVLSSLLKDILFTPSFCFLRMIMSRIVAAKMKLQNNESQVTGRAEGKKGESFG